MTVGRVDGPGRQDARWSGASPVPFWLDRPERPDALPALAGSGRCDLAVVGGGFSGLWTALRAKERDPGRDVVLLEGRRIGWAASGRNGGFCEASLTHGLENGLERYPDEIATLQRLGRENLDELVGTVARYGIACDLERSGELSVATEPWQVEALAESAANAREHGESVELLDAAATRGILDSPTYLGGLLDRQGCVMLDPARLAWGLRDACLRLGVRIHEHSRVLAMTREAAGMSLVTPGGRLAAGRVALGTNVFRSLLRRVRPHIVPVYDYVLVTEPVPDDLLGEIGWQGRYGVGDSGNQFHYYRLTADNRILWGGYDAIYHFGGRVSQAHDQRPETFRRLAEQFSATFPQLDGVRFSHAWGGAIDTCTRFCAFFGTAHRGRVAYAAGYTGLGVGASRFGADVMLDLLAGEPTKRTELRMVRRRPTPFPPEPLRYAGIQMTRASLARADRNGGRRDAWLRALDRFGLGFDS
ncbi:FAD-binding oxidoreductase [Streptomyces sp. TS71-3]|uniref:NAD(P)/FAD-dependent oxidoreductase n=1 Tax=Streptomyces sp. TS71-3 TaxID=2733862 RepID=UPI001B00FFA4|nr:FAD-dependent oxidoreductase [Streptomyces sp. TS71-3]GHJ37228.1 oxidoreductase [Streptomyces sp. TS71-3]